MNKIYLVVSKEDLFDPIKIMLEEVSDSKPRPQELEDQEVIEKHIERNYRVEAKDIIISKLDVIPMITISNKSLW